MSIKDNKEIARRFIQVWGNGNFDLLIDELAAPNISVMYPTFPQMIQGKEAFKKMLAGFRAGFPDSNLEVEEEIAEGDKVVISWNMSGTHSAPVMNIPATGKKVKWSGISIYKITKGKIIEEEGQEDILGALRQMGFVPQSQLHS